MDNQKLQTITCICIIITCVILTTKAIFKRKTEKYTTNTTPPVTGPNNMVLTDDSGNFSSIQFPAGMILAWLPPAIVPLTDGKFGTGGVYPTTPPAGWAICDGSNGTPDLRGKFLLGTNSNTWNNTNYSINEINTLGGTEKITLDIANIPPHTHGYNKNTGTCSANCPGGDNTHFMTWSDTKPSASAGGVNGSAQPFNILPPFYTVIYIMKL